MPLLGTGPATTDTALGPANCTLRKEPTFLAVDDAHLLDDVSATLLLQLAVDRVCPMVVTVRSGAPTPDAVTALWKDGLLERLEVSPLSLPETTALLEHVLGGRIQSTTARRLFAVTAGNVLWLRHLIHGERAAGRLRLEEAIWHWWGQPELNPALTALINADIGALPRSIRSVLEALALGEPLSIDVLGMLVEQADLEEAADRHLVNVRLDVGQWIARLAHPLYGEAVRAQVSAPRARRLRGQLVRALRASGATGNDVRVAVLALDSDLPPDPDLLLTAATQASLLTDMELTERLVVEALAHGGGFEAHLLHGFTLGYVFRPAEAEREFAQAALVAHTDAQRLRVAQARATNLGLVVGQPDEAHAILAAADSCTGADLELLGIRSFFAVCGNHLDDAVGQARRALDNPDVSAPCRCYAAWALSAVAALRGWNEEASKIAERGASAMLRRPETTMLRMNLAWWEILGHGLAGNPQRVRQSIDHLAGSMSGRFGTIIQPNLEGWHALVTGRIAAAVSLLSEFRPYFPGHGGGWTSLLELRLVIARGMAGDAAGAREAFERAKIARHPALGVVEPQFGLASAWLAAAEGATSEATRHARRTAKLAADSGQLAIEVLARHAAVTFGDRGQARRLSELARRVPGPRASVAAAHATAWDEHDEMGLLAAADRFEDAGLLLAAAEAAAQAESLARRRLEPKTTAVAAARTAALLGACEGARTPALRSAERPLPISDRQREVAAMAAAQLSNRDIAERLGVSIRTVEGHVYHACVKLGVPNRAALAALLGEGR